jgi:hypothetical protein
MGSQYKVAVEEYLARKGIIPDPNGALREDLDEDNEMGLDYLAYAIANYHTLPGIEENVRALAQICESDFDKEREYNNRLTEFMGLWFVSEVLQERIVALEAHSPHRPAGSKKTCDLKSESAGVATYYEVKDFSSEILTQVEVDEGVTAFSPGHPHKINRWIEGYVKNCVQKGANFLLCWAPSWHVRGRPKLTADWVKRIYPNFSALGGSRFSVTHGMSLPLTFRGVFVMRRDEHLFMEFRPTS